MATQKVLCLAHPTNMIGQFDAGFYFAYLAFDQVISAQALMLEALSLQFTVAIHSFDFGYLPDDKPGDFMGTCNRHSAALSRACRAGRHIGSAGPQGEHPDRAEADREDGAGLRYHAKTMR